MALHIISFPTRFLMPALEKRKKTHDNISQGHNNYTFVYTSSSITFIVNGLIYYITDEFIPTPPLGILLLLHATQFLSICMFFISHQKIFYEK